MRIVPSEYHNTAVPGGCSPSAVLPEKDLINQVDKRTMATLYMSGLGKDRSDRWKKLTDIYKTGHLIYMDFLSLKLLLSPQLLLAKINTNWGYDTAFLAAWHQADYIGPFPPWKQRALFLLEQILFFGKRFAFLSHGVSFNSPSPIYRLTEWFIHHHGIHIVSLF